MAAAALAFAGPASAKPGDLIVNEYGAGAVVRVDPHNGHVSPLTSGPPITSASYVAVGLGGQLAVTDENLPGIFTVNPRTGAEHQLASSGLSGPYGIDADPKGNWIVAEYGTMDPATRKVIKVNRRTGGIHTIKAGGWLAYPYGVAIDPHTGTIFVLDSGGAVDRLTPSGHRSTLASGAPLSTELWAIARAPDGTLFVTDNSTEQLYRINPRTGGVHLVASGLGSEPFGVTVGLDGKVYTTDLSVGTVNRVNPDTGNVTQVAPLSGALGIAVQPPKCGGKTATIFGSVKSDTLKGSPFKDVIAGLGRKDKITGGRGNDVICGGGGNDTLVGGPGRDKLIGGGGNDRCIGDRHDVFRSC